MDHNAFAEEDEYDARDRHPWHRRTQRSYGERRTQRRYGERPAQRRYSELGDRPTQRRYSELDDKNRRGYSARSEIDYYSRRGDTARSSEFDDYNRRGYSTGMPLKGRYSARSSEFDDYNRRGNSTGMPFKGGNSARSSEFDLYDRRGYSAGMPLKGGYPRLCEVCHISLANKRQFDSHCAGKKHEKNLRKLNSDDWDSGRPVSGELTEEMREADKEFIEYNTNVRSCKLCHVDFPSPDVEKSHRTGKRHLRNVKNAREAMGNGADLGMCDICNVVYTSNLQKKDHLNGRRHIEECALKGVVSRSDTESKKRASLKRMKRNNVIESSPKRAKIETTKSMSKKDATSKSFSATSIKKNSSKKISKQKTKNVIKSKTVSSHNSASRKQVVRRKDMDSKPTAKKNRNTASRKQVVRRKDMDSKPTAKKNITKSKPAESPQKPDEVANEVTLSDEGCPETKEETLLPHQLIEKESDEAYEKYENAVNEDSEEAPALYKIYRDIYTRYEDAYQEYLDSLNLQEVSEN